MKTDRELEVAIIKLELAWTLLSDTRDYCNYVFNTDRDMDDVTNDGIGLMMEKINDFCKLLEEHRNKLL